MKATTPFLFALVSLAVIPAAFSHSQVPKKERDSLMRQKLEYAQKVLEGIAVQDFALMEKNANNLIVVSTKAEWKALATPEYALRSDEFRRNAASVAKAGKDKNIDAATLGYVEMTMSCVSCHKHLREVRKVHREGQEDLE